MQFFAVLFFLAVFAGTLRIVLDSLNGNAARIVAALAGHDAAAEEMVAWPQWRARRVRPAHQSRVLRVSRRPVAASPGHSFAC